MHWLWLVQRQALGLHWWEASQHSPVRQSLVVQQPAIQLPPQQTSPLGHWLVVVQPQAALLHCWEASQHSPARQSLVEQQPLMHWP